VSLADESLGVSGAVRLPLVRCCGVLTISLRASKIKGCGEVWLYRQGRGLAPMQAVDEVTELEPAEASDSAAKLPISGEDIGG
jgi:hypothetical protein